jgi:undecaprenyl-diphosphatase
LESELDVLIWLHDDSTAARAVNDASELGPLAAVGIVVLVVLLVRRRWRDVLFFAAAVGVVWAVNPLLKEFVGRSRPDLWPLPADVSEYSFPSGHAANAAALVGALALLVRRLPVVLLGAALLLVVGWSQLALGRHYPTDVLAGWVWALAWVVVLRRMTKGGPG